MSIDLNGKIGIFIECGGTIGKETWCVEDLTDETFYLITGEGHGLPKGKDYWGLNKNRKNIDSIHIHRHVEQFILAFDEDIVKRNIENFKSEFDEQYAKLEKLYLEHDIKIEVKFGAYATYN